MFFWSEQITGPRGVVIDCYFTDREGGVSTGELGSLNLSGAVGDDPANVETNRGKLAAALGVDRSRLLLMSSRHSTTVVPVIDRSPSKPADGMVTATPGSALVALAADCVPILLYDAIAGVVSAVHAGRVGMADGIVGEAVRVLRRAGAEQIHAIVGPAICGRCYEVPGDLQESVAGRWPVTRSVTWRGTPAIDVPAGVVWQLAEAGVEVRWVPGCTMEDPNLFSHRRGRPGGRGGGVIVLREAAS
ncbi:polyphenol oxidase family protein [Branchiibius cervicis]|uniref:Polyphenol oxidase family protein n=1 Tax=Branchiibius cervicis TaxID=908252 RepID=A0ABW2ARL7_9MICO